MTNTTKRFTYGKMLTMVLLLKCTSMAVAKLSPGDVERDENAWNMDNGESYGWKSRHGTIRKSVKEADDERGFNIDNLPKLSQDATSLASVSRMAPNHQLTNESPEELFAKMNLKDIEGNLLFESQEFVAWEELVRTTANDVKTANEDLISVLVSNFGDYGLANILVQAKQNPDTKEVATKYWQLLLSHWRVNRKEPTDNIFNLLKLGQGDGNHQLWETWIAYVYQTSNNPYRVIQLKLLELSGDNKASEELATELVAKFLPSQHTTT